MRIGLSTVYPFPVSRKKKEEEQEEQEEHTPATALPAPDPLAEAKKVLTEATPEAAQTVVTIMRSGSKEDLVQLQAANHILAVGGIAPAKARDDSSARIAGAAVLAAIAGMARVAGLRNVTPATFKKVLTEEASALDLPPELLEEQDTLR